MPMSLTRFEQLPGMVGGCGGPGGGGEGGLGSRQRQCDRAWLHVITLEVNELRWKNCTSPRWLDEPWNTSKKHQPLATLLSKLNGDGVSKNCICALSSKSPRAT